MKDSGIEWIGEIPESWDAIATKRFFSIISGATPKSENPQYFDGDIIWITPADYKTEDVFVSKGRRNITKEGLNSCNTSIIPAGSIVFSKRAPIGSVAINSVELCTNQGCLSCIPQANVDTKYYYYSMSIYTDQYNLLGSGTTFKEISATSFSDFKLPTPPLSEQRSIAAYLDRQCAHIDNIIEKTKASIEEYKKLRQAIITQAVTKGVREDRAMKATGFDWLLQIPADWTMKRGKNLFFETNNRSDNGDEELLTVSQYTGVTPRSQKNVNMFEAETLEGYKICEIGDIAANTMWLWAGAIGVSEYYGVISPSYNIYRQKNNAYNSKYLDYLLRIPPIVQLFASLSTGIRASRLRLYPEQFLNIYYPIPPLDEQAEIVAYLQEKIVEVDKLITKKEQFLTELESYKRSMIYEYVTGKKEVPSA